MHKKYLKVGAIILVISILIAGCTNKDITKIQEPIEKPQPIEEPLPVEEPEPIEKISLEADLSNVINLDDFESFSDDELKMLSEANFFVRPSDEEQLFFIYEHNEYQEIPSFVTTDSVLQVYHIFYNYTLRTLEEQRLIQLARDLSKDMLVESIKQYDLISDDELKESSIKNIAFFTVANKLIKNELPENIPSRSLNMANREYQKIMEKQVYEKSEIFPFEIDYSQYTIRGHYTRSEDLGDYFLTMMWYGQIPLPLYKNEEERNYDQTYQALLITDILSNDGKIFNTWKKIYQPTEHFVGSSDDLNIYDYKTIYSNVYKDISSIDQLKDNDKIDAFYKEADKLPMPKIMARFLPKSDNYNGIDSPVGKQFRFMGQRYVMDSEMIQRLVYPILRPIPSGLDVMAVLGSNRAKEIQLNDPINQMWEDYPIVMEELIEEFSHYTEADWKKNMYTGWMWVLSALNQNEYGDEYPDFMKNEAWIDKSLNTALSSWAELKHDTVLYGKPSGAEMGGDMIKETKGYVEPSIEVYERLLWLTDRSRELLKEMNLEIDDIDIKMERFQWLLDFLITASQKQLKGEALTQEEYFRLTIFGGILEDLTLSFSNVGRWHEITSETDKNMAVIADYHTVGRDGMMHAGVGPAYEIYAIVPIEGELVLTRGAVFSFHEFLSETRLTDEKWQEMIKSGNYPSMPEWTDSFIVK